jgi:DNA-binding response OmpR family regulator
MSKGYLLVIEDHRLTALALKQFLEISAYRVDVVETVAEALSAATARSYDLLVCDLNLPDGTGWDLLEMLQREQRVRAVAFSAYDDAEHIARSRAAGFMDHIVKGTDPDEVLRRIDALIKAPLKRKPSRRRATKAKVNTTVAESKLRRVTR